MKFYVLVKPETQEVMAFNYDRRPIPSLVVPPQPIAVPNLAENYQSLMNCDFGGGWEVATIDLETLQVVVSKTDNEELIPLDCEAPQ